MRQRTVKPSQQRRLMRRAAERAARPSSKASTADLMAPGAPRKHKRTAQPAQPAGNGHGLSGWSQPATLPFTLAVTASDRRWDMTASGSHR